MSTRRSCWISCNCLELLMILRDLCSQDSLKLWENHNRTQASPSCRQPKRTRSSTWTRFTLKYTMPSARVNKPSPYHKPVTNNTTPNNTSNPNNQQSSSTCHKYKNCKKYSTSTTTSIISSAHCQENSLLSWPSSVSPYLPLYSTRESPSYLSLTPKSFSKLNPFCLFSIRRSPTTLL